MSRLLLPVFCFLFLFGAIAFQAKASVVMNGTRVIYSADARERTLQLVSTDAYPNLVQVWVDRGNPDSTVENADAPFVASPQIFRMEPHAGQMVRLMYVGEGLPQDRETLFFLNFSQMPAIKVKDRDASKLVLMFNSRIKIFYRPKGILGRVDSLAQRMSFHLGKGEVHVDNPTGYYAVVRQAYIETRGQNIMLAESLIIPPFTRTKWSSPVLSSVAKSDLRLRLILVNDYGVDVSTDVLLN
ncbi:TPA: fimbrial biogenesis chaperone [Pseudomonas aeruginosa]